MDKFPIRTTKPTRIRGDVSNQPMKAFNTLHQGNVCCLLLSYLTPLVAPTLKTHCPTPVMKSRRRELFLPSEGTNQVDPIANKKLMNQQSLKLSHSCTGHSVQPETQIQGNKSTIGRAHHMDFWHQAADISSAAPCNPPPSLFRVKRAKQQASSVRCSGPSRK